MAEGYYFSMVREKLYTQFRPQYVVFLLFEGCKFCENLLQLSHKKNETSISAHLVNLKIKFFGTHTALITNGITSTNEDRKTPVTV